jgi:hypothetical protein
MFAVFSLGALVASISLGAIQIVNAASGTPVTTCVNKSTGSMRYIKKGNCKKSESKILLDRGVSEDAFTTESDSRNLHVVDASGQDLGTLVSTDSFSGYSFLKDGGIWTAHPGVMDYSAIATNYYSDSFCSSPVGAVRYSTDVSFTTTLVNERYVTKKGSATSGYKPIGTPFRGQTVNALYQWSSVSNRCVLTYTNGSLATVLFVYLTPVPLPTYTAPLALVNK